MRVPAFVRNLFGFDYFGVPHVRTLVSFEVKPADGRKPQSLVLSPHGAHVNRYERTGIRVIEVTEMELPGVEQIVVDDATNAVLRDVDETARRVNEVRPLPMETLNVLLKDLLGERVYTSNAIEGNTLDLRETREVLKTGHLDIPKRREATEARNLGRAIEYSQQHLVDPNAPFAEDEFLKVHGMLLQDVNDDWAGRFRDGEVVIPGATHQPPAEQHVPEMVSRFFERLNEVRDVHPVLLATWAHWTIARIHPFSDGNGRMARLWQDIILFRHKLTCAIIRPEDRTDYLEALEDADEGRFNSLTQLVAQRILSTLDKYVVAQQRSDELREWAKELAGEVDERAVQQWAREYQGWLRNMENIRFGFEHCAALVNQAAGKIEIQMRPYEAIDQSMWQIIRSGGTASKNWFFTLEFRRDPQRVRYIFFFGKHYWSEDDTEDEPKAPCVSLLIAEQGRANELARRLGEAGFDTRLSIRELFFIENRLVRKRYDETVKKEVYDRGVDTMTVAQEFIQDVLLVRMVKP
ncbi:MAG: Fic family protein [Phycisphaerae bacterium]